MRLPFIHPADPATRAARQPLAPISAIVTIPPYARFIDEVARHPAVSGLRLNTVMPTKDPLESVLKRLHDATEGAGGKDLFIDLKARQLRVQTFGVPPFTEIELSHRIALDTHSHIPAVAYFHDGLETATVLEVADTTDGARSKLIMQEGPKRVVGPGESVNIMHPSLRIEGFLTGKDKEYIEAANKVGLRQYMLSFVEHAKDIAELRTYAPGAQVVAKLESLAGVHYAKHAYEKKKDPEVRLMAARGDLYIQLKLPHHVIGALETILDADPEAIVASRIFSSLSESGYPSCADIGDADNLMRMGYRTLMLGDDICQQRDSVLSALNLLDQMAQRYS
jgi:pyruvate kinase